MVNMEFVRRLLLGTAALALVGIACPATQAQTPTVAQASGGARAAAPVLTTEQKDLYAKAFTAADAGRWDEVRRLSAQGKEPMANKVLRWLELQQPRSGASFEDLALMVKEGEPFTPAVVGTTGTLISPAAAECRTSDITLAEFKTLTGIDVRHALTTTVVFYVAVILCLLLLRGCGANDQAWVCSAV